MSYPMFTVQDGTITSGATVQSYELANGHKVPAIIIGEKGRGRRPGVLPVHLPDQLFQEWREAGQVDITAASVGKSRAGKPRLIASSTAEDTSAAIVVLRSPIGYRGSNDHTGDRAGWICPQCKTGGPEPEPPDTCPKGCSAAWRSGRPRLRFKPFPGETLADGVIAQGDAGRMGSGHQYVAVIPEGKVFRVGYSGRRYGKPAAYYYMFQNGEIIAATWEERTSFDLF